jgi:hypothetical protein
MRKSPRHTVSSPGPSSSPPNPSSSDAAAHDAGDDLSAVAAVFYTLPEHQRKPAASFAVFCMQSMTAEDRGMLIKLRDSEKSDRQVASLCGVSLRTLRRWERYREFKTLLEARKPVTTKWRGRSRRRVEAVPVERD